MADTQRAFRAAVIGLGFIGAADQVSGDAIGQQVRNLDGTHAQALQAHPQVELVAGSSRDEGRRERFSERTGCRKTYADWREMLAAEQLDIVSIATNSPHHGEITVACAEAGVRAVLCEKPVTTRLSDADRAIAACRQHGTVLAINHLRRWNPMWIAARDELASGAIGDIEHLTAHWTSGRLGNIGTHVFDACRMLLGADPVAVSGRLDPVVPPDCRGPQFRDPGGWGIVEFCGGVKAYVHAGAEARAPIRVCVVGSEGQMTVRRDDARVELWSGERRDIPVPVDRPTSLELAVRDLVDCLSHGTQPACTGEDGRAALEVTIGFHVSDRLNGAWVPLPVTGDDRHHEVPIG